MNVTAEQLFDKLINEYQIVGKTGGIKFKMHDLEIDIEARDAVGNHIQERLAFWMTRNSIDFHRGSHSQDFPDFYLNTEDHTKDLLEVKSFDFNRGANFDVANFLAYRRSLLDNVHRLNSSYLIIGYRMTGNVLEIANVWLQKVWQITGPSENWPLKCQVKQGEVVNIRPAKWHTNDRTRYKPFASALGFVEAFDATQRQWERTARDPDTSTWLTRVKRAYRETTGSELA